MKEKKKKTWRARFLKAFLTSDSEALGWILRVLYGSLTAAEETHETLNPFFLQFFLDDLFFNCWTQEPDAEPHPTAAAAILIFLFISQ